MADSAYSQHPSHLTQESTTLQCTVPMVSYVQPTILDSEELHSMIHSLNKQQRLAFDTVLTYCRNVVKYPSDHNFIGKSHLIKTIYQMATQTFKQVSENPEKPSVFLLTQTGISAVSISGTTINTGLSILVDNFSCTVSLLPDIERSRLRNQLSELKMIIIDEISMVSNMKLLFVHQRLKDIFGTPQYSLFAGKAIIAVGDLSQLPPYKGKPVLTEYSKDMFNLCHPWRDFTMIELTEIIQQMDDRCFAELLNRLRTRTFSDNDLEILKSRVIISDNPNYPWEALHVFPQKSLVNDHNNMMLERLQTQPVKLVAIDKFPSHVPSSVIDKTLSQSYCQTGGLHKELIVRRVLG